MVSLKIDMWLNVYCKIDGYNRRKNTLWIVKMSLFFENLTSVSHKAANMYYSNAKQTNK